MKKIYAFTIAQFFLVSFLSAQRESCVTLHGRMIELNLPDSTTRIMTGAPIEIWSDDSLMAVIYSQEKGRYDISLPFFHKYRIRYGGGKLISKIVEIDASDFAEKARERGYELNIDIILFQRDGIDGISFLDTQPFASASYSLENNSVIWNIGYIERIDKQVQDMVSKSKFPAPSNPQHP